MMQHGFVDVNGSRISTYSLNNNFNERNKLYKCLVTVTTSLSLPQPIVTMSRMRCWFILPISRFRLKMITETDTAGDTTSLKADCPLTILFTIHIMSASFCAVARPSYLAQTLCIRLIKDRTLKKTSVSARQLLSLLQMLRKKSDSFNDGRISAPIVEYIIVFRCERLKEYN